MSDIVERLRGVQPVSGFNAAGQIEHWDASPSLRDLEAADEIERLRQQNITLRTLFRVNMIRAAGASHAEIDAALAEALGETV
jgi:uncharacterized membrane protein